MNKKVIGIVIAIVVIIAAIIIAVVAMNANNDDNGGNGNGNGNQITDTSVQGDVVEGTSLVVTELEPGALGARVTFVNAGDTMQNYIVKATFLDANGNEIATGKATAAVVEPGESKETPMSIDGEWEDYATVEYAIHEDDAN